MLAILIMTVIGMGIVILCVATNMPMWSAGYVVIALGIVIGLFCGSDYKEGELVKTTELVALSNSTTSESEECIFVERSKENVYTYRYAISSKYGKSTSTEYETDTISGNVIESEDPNCEVPVLLEYKKKAKPTIWTFGFFDSKTEYVFYVPTGTIDRVEN